MESVGNIASHKHLTQAERLASALMHCVIPSLASGAHGADAASKRNA